MLFTELIPPLALYLLAAITPGPANLAIMETAMKHGRIAGFFMVSGVMSGSQFWGISAAFGVSTLLTASSYAIPLLSMIGAGYFFRLSWQSLLSANEHPDNEYPNPEGSNHTSDNTHWQTSQQNYRHHFLKGLIIHLLNPKAVFGWVALMAIAIAPGASSNIEFYLLLSSLFLGFLVFGSYALVFSHKAMMRFYLQAKSFIHYGTSVVFLISALGLVYMTIQQFKL